MLYASSMVDLYYDYEDELSEMESEDLETWVDYYVIETDSIDDEDEQ